jgi:hypothetical protein
MTNHVLFLIKPVYQSDGSLHFSGRRIDLAGYRLKDVTLLENYAKL